MIATNIGSLPWRGGPLAGELEAALAGHAAGSVGREDLQAVQDRATRQSLEAQVDAGLDLPTDGLVRRADPASHFISRLGGVRLGGERRDPFGAGGSMNAPIVEQEIHWSAPVLVEDFLFAREGCERPIKVVLTGPFTLSKIAEDRAYGDANALAMGLASAVNQELKSLQTAGATLVQVDEPALLAHREEFPFFTRIWEVLGRGITARLALHLPGGDLGGLYPALLRLKRLAWLSLDAVAGRGNLDRLREHPFPDGPGLGLGLIDGRSEAVEAPEEIVRTIASCGGLPPHDRLWIGPASDLGNLPQPTALAKLKSAALAARMAERG